MTEDELPKGWCTTTLGELGHLKGGLAKGKRRDSKDRPRLVPYLRVANVQRGHLDLREVKQIEATDAEIGDLRLLPGDVLFNEGGDRDKLGRGWVWRGEVEECIHQNHVFRLRPSPAAASEYLSHYGNHLGQGYFIESGKQTTNLASISMATLRALPVRLPPIAEQRRIVAKLDALNERSRRAKAALDAIPPLVERFKQSVLAAAFRGDLTADWRAAHPDVEPASELLKRIRVERRRRWEEAELAKLKAKGKTPTDDRWKAKYVEPEPVDESELPELPESWCWAPLELMADPSRGIPYGIVLTGDHDPDGVPTVRCGDIKNFSIDLDLLKRVRPTVASEFARTRLLGGEVLIAIRGTVGATAVAVPAMRDFNISREVAMVPVLRGIAPVYAMYALAAPASQARLLKEVKGVAQSGINLSDLRTLLVPVAPEKEQEALVHSVQTALARTDRFQLGLARTAMLTENLERAILAKAFRGELVPQDPSDEPASALLERIRTENANGSAASIRRKKTTVESGEKAPARGRHRHEQSR